MAYALISLVQILEQDQHHLVLDSECKLQIESLLEEARVLKELVARSSELESLGSTIRDVVHNAEDMIEFHVMDQTLPRRELDLSGVIAEFGLIGYEIQIRNRNLDLRSCTDLLSSQNLETKPSETPSRPQANATGRLGYDINQIAQQAMARWLHPDEILFILENFKEHQLTHQVPLKPTSGSIYLLNKQIVKDIHEDGYSWRRKRISKTIIEAHEELKAGLNCYYAHGDVNPNFQKRRYWKSGRLYEHIALVHYRDIGEGKLKYGSTYHFSQLSTATFTPGFNSFATTPTSSSCITEKSFGLYSSIVNDYFIENSLSLDQQELRLPIAQKRKFTVEEIPSDLYDTSKGAKLAAGDSGNEHGIFVKDNSCGLTAASKSELASALDHNTAALSIQKKYRGWKQRKDFLSLRQKVVKTQARVRGYQVRKIFKLTWAVGVLEKVIMRWRQRGVGLRGFRHDIESIDQSDKEDILKVFSKQKADAVTDEAVSKVLSMVESPDTRQQYHLLLERYRQAEGELNSGPVASTSENVDQVSLELTLAAVKNSSHAALRIQSAFRAHLSRKIHQREAEVTLDDDCEDESGTFAIPGLSRVRGVKRSAYLAKRRIRSKDKGKRSRKNNVMAALPKNGKFLITTFLRTGVQKKQARTGKENSDIVSFTQDMVGIDDDSWALLRWKVFGQDSFSPEIQLLGKRIAKACGDLPLAINLIAAFLSSSKYSQRLWELIVSKLTQLRHVISKETCIWYYPRDKDVLQGNLQTLSNIHVFLLTNKFIESIPNLTKLGIFCDSSLRTIIGLDCLQRLETLKCAASWSSVTRDFLSCLRFPPSLKKLTLSSCKLPCEFMTVVGSLSNLEHLKLQNSDFLGMGLESESDPIEPEWEPVEGEFIRLKSLLMKELNLVHWRACANHFPCLQRLVIRDCCSMTEIPRDIGEIETLKVIEVDESSPSLLDSANRIKDERSLAYNFLQLHIWKS